MKRNSQIWLALAVCISVLPVAGSLFWSEVVSAQTPVEGATAPKIMIWVYNYARVPGRTLAGAETEVQRTFDAAGVHVEWIECPTSAEEVKARPVCQDRMSNAELAVTVFPTAKSVGSAYADKYFGFAQVFNNGQFGHYAYVFYDRVRDTAYVVQVSESQLLASVICHEFGHLLMRSNTHSNSGIMRGRWDRNDLKNLTWGRLSFTSEEVQMIHTEALARLRSSAELQTIPRNAVPPGNR